MVDRDRVEGTETMVEMATATEMEATTSGMAMGTEEITLGMEMAMEEATLKMVETMVVMGTAKAKAKSHRTTDRRDRQSGARRK